jgi:hypothetical protein
MTPKITQKTVHAKQGALQAKSVRVTAKTLSLKQATDVARQCGQVHVFKIGETRSNLPQMVNCLQSGATTSYVVGPYGKPSVALVSYERFRPLLANGTKNERFALLIADELLPDAPQHLWTSAIEELSALPKSDLLSLWKLTAGSSDDEISTLRSQLRHPAVLDRLMLRIRVAQSIAEAREAGLYDAAESMTSAAFENRG